MTVAGAGIQGESSRVGEPIEGSPHPPLPMGSSWLCSGHAAGGWGGRRWEAGMCPAFQFVKGGHPSYVRPCTDSCIRSLILERNLDFPKHHL